MTARGHTRNYTTLTDVIFARRFGIADPLHEVLDLSNQPHDLVMLFAVALCGQDAQESLGSFWREPPLQQRSRSSNWFHTFVFCISFYINNQSI